MVCNGSSRNISRYLHGIGGGAMAIHRIKNKKEYVTMAKYHFKDYELSWKAKGILSLMLSLPDDWEFSYKGLAAMSSDSQISLKAGVEELKSKGYLTISKYRDKQGKIRYSWEVFEKPKPYIQKPYTDEPYTVEPTTDKPYTDEPYTVNRTQLNNK